MITMQVVPVELRGLRQWVMWRAKDKPDGKIDKIPFQPNAKPAASDNPATWHTLNECLAAQRGFSGIGIMFGNGLAGVDLDHVISEDETLHDEARAIVDRLKTYTEISPYGTGVHCLMWAKLPPGRRVKDPPPFKVELYDGVRFFTFTGHHLAGTPHTIEHRDGELAALHADLFPPAALLPKTNGHSAGATVLDDATLLDLARHAKNRAKFEAVWGGDLSHYKRDESDADFGLCSMLAFWTQDRQQIDRLFRQSALMRDKWDSKRGQTTYGQVTIEKAIAGAHEHYTPPRTNGNRHMTIAQSARDADGEPADAESAARPRKRPRITSFEYMAALSDLGYSFRLNECNDELEVNGEPMSDPLRSAIRSALRDHGYPRVNVAEDAYIAEARERRYHPVREYLDALQYDGGDHIEWVAHCFDSRHGVFGAWFRFWIVNAVRKVYRGTQNKMLVLDGRQGIGKSHFVRWLCPLPHYFIQSPIDTNDKDAYTRLMSKWIWEVAELGATTRRTDREALKHFISMEEVTVRKAYGRYDVRKPALASFVGTVNNEGGLLTDPTGHRRFLIAHIDEIDWRYTRVNVSQLWAQAVALYRAGACEQLTIAEQEIASVINETYEVDDAIEGLLKRYYLVDQASESWIPTADILEKLETNGLRGHTRANAMALSATMTRLGLEKTKGENAQGQRVWGYQGVSPVVLSPGQRPTSVQPVQPECPTF